MEDNELSFLKRNPLLRMTSSGGRVYGGVKDVEEMEAEDLEDILKRSDGIDIMQKLLRRERSLGIKLSAALISSLHDRDIVLVEQLYLRLMSERISNQNLSERPSFMTGL